MTRRGATAPSSQIAWQLVELHGCWWACEGDLPPPEAFQSHRRQPQPPILGPYATRAVAEAMLHRRLSRRDPEVRTPRQSPLVSSGRCNGEVLNISGFLSRQADRRRHSLMSSWRIYPH
jgi:hypothetical protein